jgi:glucosamine-6-phosphate deaminase
LHRCLFSQVDLQAHNAHVLDGTVPEAFAAAHAMDFDHWIEADGGLDVQLLGIGRNATLRSTSPAV